MIEVGLDEIIREVRAAEKLGYNQAIDDIAAMFRAASKGRNTDAASQSLSLPVAEEMVKQVKRR